VGLEASSVTLIAAADPNWIVGMGGHVPWSYPVLDERFDRMTRGGLLVQRTTPRGARGVVL
jgi:dihydrofolate reductase